MVCQENGARSLRRGDINHCFFVGIVNIWQNTKGIISVQALLNAFIPNQKLIFALEHWEPRRQWSASDPVKLYETWKIDAGTSYQRYHHQLNPRVDCFTERSRIRLPPVPHQLKTRRSTALLCFECRDDGGGYGWTN